MLEGTLSSYRSHDTECHWLADLHPPNRVNVTLSEGDGSPVGVLVDINTGCISLFHPGIADGSTPPRASAEMPCDPDCTERWTFTIPDTEKGKINERHGTINFATDEAQLVENGSTIARITFDSLSVQPELAQQLCATKFFTRRQAAVRNAGIRNIVAVTKLLAIATTPHQS